MGKRDYQKGAFSRPNTATSWVNTEAERWDKDPAEIWERGVWLGNSHQPRHSLSCKWRILFAPVTDHHQWKWMILLWLEWKAPRGHGKFTKSPRLVLLRRQLSEAGVGFVEGLWLEGVLSCGFRVSPRLEHTPSNCKVSKIAGLPWGLCLVNSFTLNNVRHRGRGHQIPSLDGFNYSYKRLNGCLEGWGGYTQ